MQSRTIASTRAIPLFFYSTLVLAGALWAAAPARAAQEPVSAPAQVTAVVGGLDHPWAMAFLPDGGGVLITERPGKLRLLRTPGGLSKPLAGVPKVAASGQGGLLDVALSPDFAKDRYVYLSYAESDGDKSGTVVGRGRLSADATALEDFKVLFRQMPKLSSGLHFGSRLVFDRNGYLFISLGENNQRPTAQDLDKLQGKIVRLNRDGSVPTDNPFVGKPGARPEIWSYGHRNPQGMALNPWSGELWENEHGPRGGDEINRIQPGKNYGWPLATYGINYSGQPIPEAKGETVPGTEPPLFWWAKSPAISGMAFYDADRFPAWKHSVFIGALANQNLIRLTLDGNRVVGQEWLLGDRKSRIRDVRQGPDGYVYVLTDASPGQLLRLAPAPTGG
ncbi:MAG: PQQ-dependent sugar dehydrogenase [Achromobacter sp.]|uniref:PQQ-dependent sugar dehydrogenase n=1 Tax=Achromobacter sp. TaxID=134375 RepID=UPI0012CB1BE0|nr:PQQ-dependent sugar dehydrogenase [Achromobacter sp.]